MSPLALKDDFALGQVTPSILLYEPSFEGWLSVRFITFTSTSCSMMSRYS